MNPKTVVYFISFMILVSILAGLVGGCAAPAQPAAPEAVVIEYQPPQQVEVLVPETTVRSLPSLDADAVKVLQEGTSVQKLRKQGPWVQISGVDVEGWVLEEVVGLRAAAQQPTREPILSLQPTNTPLKPVATKTPTPLVPTPTATKSPTPQADAIVSTDALNVRHGPDRTYMRVGMVFRGDALDVLGQQKGCTWLQVRSPSRVVGWVFSEFVQLNLKCGQIQVVEAPTYTPTPRSTPTPAGGGTTTVPTPKLDDNPTPMKPTVMPTPTEKLVDPSPPAVGETPEPTGPPPPPPVVDKTPEPTAGPPSPQPTIPPIIILPTQPIIILPTIIVTFGPPNDSIQQEGARATSIPSASSQ